MYGWRTGPAPGAGWWLRGPGPVVGGPALRAACPLVPLWLWSMATAYGADRQRALC